MAAFMSSAPRLDGWHVSPALTSEGMAVFLKMPHRIFAMFLQAHPISLLFPARTEGRLEDRLLFEGTKILYGSSCHVNCCVLLILSLCEEKQKVWSLSP